jgi:septum formation protein
MTNDSLILASGSPRRAELLASAGLTFEVVPAEIDETPLPGETSEDVVSRLSRQKAESVFRDHPSSIVLAADTVVEHDGDILGKPRAAEEARRMLHDLSGDTHEVMTGFTVCFPDGRRVTRVVVTEVEFRELSREEIDRVVASGDPMDKAGAYGIQSGAAGFVSSIRGSYTNVVGLPLAQVLEVLADG